MYLMLFLICLVFINLLLFGAKNSKTSSAKIQWDTKTLDEGMLLVEKAVLLAKLSAMELRVASKTVPVTTQDEKYGFLSDLATIARDEAKLESVDKLRIGKLIGQVQVQYPDLGYTAQMIEQIAQKLHVPKHAQAVRTLNRVRYGGSSSASSSPAWTTTTIVEPSQPLSARLLRPKDSKKIDGKAKLQAQSVLSTCAPLQAQAMQSVGSISSSAYSSFSRSAPLQSQDVLAANAAAAVVAAEQSVGSSSSAPLPALALVTLDTQAPIGALDKNIKSKAKK